MDTLYSLTDDLKRLLELAPSLDPEDAQAFEDTLTGILGARDDKLDGYAVVIRTMEAENELTDHEITRLQNRMKARANRINRMKERMMESMNATGQRKLETELHTIAIQKNGGVQPLTITGEVPAEYIKQKPITDTDKIREALNRGTKLSFAHLEERGEHLVIK